MDISTSRPLSEKAKIVLPIAGSVAALFVFLILVWPTSPNHGKRGKQAHARSGHADDSRGAGWRSEDSDRRTTRNSEGTDGGGVGTNSRRDASAGSGRGSKASEGGTWWYHEDGAKDRSGGEGGWWYH